MAKKSGHGGIMIIGIVLVLLVAVVFIYKKMKGKPAPAPMPSLDTIVKNSTAATQQAHSARLTCGSCGGH
jgi:hypothetical protein